MQEPMKNKIRRYDLDWLRVLVFGLLIFYHVGRFFVPWEWHINNNILYSELEYPMLFVNQWRLPILFVISGMGTRYALAYRSGATFRKERLIRLGLPLLIGMLIIVPPQVYVERIVSDHYAGSYVTYYFSDAFTGIYPNGNISWHHLWFLPYLLIYSLLLSPLFIYIRNNKNSIRSIYKIINYRFGLYIFVIPLFLTEAFIAPIFPVTRALLDDWFAFTNFLLLFFYGYLLIATGDVFWRKVDDIKTYALGIGIVSFCLLMWLGQQGNSVDNLYVHFTTAFIKVLNLWSWIITIFGFASKYLNRKSTILKYCNEAVYPFYILHQTVTIVIAYFLFDRNWSLWLKFTLLSVGTFLICWVIYEFIIRRSNLLRPLFGLKKHSL